MTDNPPEPFPTITHYGHELRIEQNGCEVSIIFVTATQEQADTLAQRLVAKVIAGDATISILGTPRTVEVRHPDDEPPTSLQ